MRVIIGVDRSPEAEQACRFVADRPWQHGTTVVLVAASSPRVELASMSAVTVDTVVEDRDALQELLEERADLLRPSGLSVETEIAAGSAADVLLEVARTRVADLIVVGSRRRGPFTSAVLGSVSAALTDHAPCPVLVVRAPRATRMLVATDGTHSSRSIPTVLAAWGPAFRGLPVEVVSVAPRHGFVTPWAGPSTTANGEGAELVLHQGIAETVADELMELGWHAAATVRTGAPDHEIVAAGEAWGADLIITGSRGIGSFHRLLSGSVAHEVLLHTSSSVLVMRGQVPAPIGAVRVMSPAVGC